MSEEHENEVSGRVEDEASAADSLDQQITQSLKKLNIDDINWGRYEITPEELLYLLDHAPYLQMVSTGTGSPTLPEPELITARSGWTIHHYGDAMSSSPGALLFSGGYFPIHDDEDGRGASGDGRGTIRKQAFDTAADMIALAKRMGWSGVHVVDGHPSMEWAAWMAAQDQGMSLAGYTPSEKDMKKRERVKRSEMEDRAKLDSHPQRR